MRLLACLIVAPQRGYDEPAILSYAISSFCPTSADGLHDYDDIRAFFNICELIAVGVNKGAFSKSVSEAYWGDVIPEVYKTAKQQHPHHPSPSSTLRAGARDISY